jgi:glycerol-3-phosphate dehydrogenase
MLRHLIYVAGQDLSFSQAMGPTVHGNIILGLGRFQEPESRTDMRVTRQELECIIQMGRQIIPELPERHIITYFAGIKTTNNLADKGDFYIGPASVSPTLIHALICSPGITASPGIARKMLEILSNAGLDLVEKPDFNPCNEKPFHFRDADEDERSRAIESDCRCGHLVCRCEQVSEAEVRNAVERGVATIDGVKHLTRAGMGRCQGGFCGPAVIKILSEELGIDAENLSRKGKGSEELSL